MTSIVHARPMNDVARANPARKKDSAATKAAILDAARRVFTAVGYDNAGMREIAAEAGVHASLVGRYFGSKRGLFEAAVPSTFSIEPYLRDDREAFARALVEHMLDKPKGDYDATLALIRSAGNPDAAELLRAGLEERFVAPLADWIGSAAGPERASLLLAFLAGLAVMRDVLTLPALQSDTERFRQSLVAIVSSAMGD
jgi:AcrR family transcriptional regulator